MMNEPPKYMTKNARMRHLEKRHEVEELACSSMKALKDYEKAETGTYA